MKCYKNKIKTGVFLLVFLLQLTGCQKEETFALDPIEVQEEAAKEEQGQEIQYKKEKNADCYVHICGAVKAPGVYTLRQGDRVWDAVEKAEGFRKNASETYVNLAEPVQDGMKIYIPTKEEVLSMQELSEKDGLVNINTAALDELCTLTGIGKSRAQAIIDYRSEHGNFEKIEDIMQVAGIKESSFAKIKKQITV